MACGFTHDLLRMHNKPTKIIRQVQDQAEILTLLDYMSFDTDLDFVGEFDGPSLFNETQEYLLICYEFS